MDFVILFQLDFLFVGKQYWKYVRHFIQLFELFLDISDFFVCYQKY